MSSIGDDAAAQVQEETTDSASGSEYEDETKRREVDDSGDSESERDGRFHGPDSSWRFYTKEDRAIASSLDQAENNDLSAHLYNAHAWKRAIRDDQRIREALPWHSKHRWIQPNDTGRTPFQPPASWTAWPLRPEDVPRSQEQWGIPAADPADEADTFAKREPWRPGLHLHEELKAAFMRKAKESFREREQATALQKQTAVQYARSETPSGTVSKTARSESGRSDSNETDEDQILSENVKNEGLDEDEAVVAPEAGSDYEVEGDGYEPSLLLDDDLATSILGPTVHHITARLDDLLVGLHKSRLGHRQDRSRSRGSRSGSQLRSKSRERPHSAASVPSKRKRTVSDVKQEGPDSVSENSESEVEGRSERDPQRGSRRRLPAPRDWSEVLGVAAMVGWDPQVLDRAARRCAAIFGESMTMRVMPETSFGNYRDQIVDYVPDMVPPIDDHSSGDDMVSEDEPQGPPDLACPKLTCPRYREPYTSAWRLREHLRKSHKLPYEEVNSLVPHVSAAPASRNREIKTERASGDEQEDDSESEDVPMRQVHEVDAVRPDGFLQPIDIRLHRSKDKQPRKRSTSRPKAEDISAE